MSVLRKLWEPTASKPRPSSGIGVVVVILATIAVCVSMCEHAVNRIETEEINMGEKQ